MQAKATICRPLSSLGRILFDDKLLGTDDTNSTYSFLFKGTMYAIILPKLAFWIQLLYVSVIQSVFVVITSSIVYWTMVKPTLKQKQRNIIQNYLVGYGCVIPLILIYPIFIVQLFGIRNKIIRFVFAVVPIASLFRCTEAMYGYIPAGLDVTFKKYFIYNWIPLEIQIDPNTKKLVKITRSYVVKNLMQFIFLFFKVSILLSLLASRDFSPFQKPTGFSFLSTFHLGRILNNAIAGILFEQVLSVLASSNSLLFAFVTRVQIVELMKSAMFSSTSPVSRRIIMSEFLISLSIDFFYYVV